VAKPEGDGVKERVYRNAVALAGLVAVLIGVSAFDWRLGCVVGGLLLLSGAITGMAIAARKGKR